MRHNKSYEKIEIYNGMLDGEMVYIIDYGEDCVPDIARNKEKLGKCLKEQIMLPCTNTDKDQDEN